MPILKRRSLLRLSLALAPPLLSGRAAFAASYPDKPVRLAVAFPPGGPSDVLARIVGQQLSQDLGQAIVIDNRPGAGGNIAAEIVAKAPPDGYTLLMGNNSILAANEFLYSRLSFDPIKDFAPIALIGSQPNILVVNSALPVHSVADLIALAKAKPGELNYASSGNGTAAHLAAELFRLRTGTQMTHVAYPGAAPALTDLVSGQVQLMFATAASVVSFIRNNMVRAIAVTTLTRSTSEPDLPTIAESGLPGFEAVTWHGLVAPARTPPSVVARLNAATLSALRDPGVIKHLGSLDVVIAGDTPEAFTAYIKADAAKWGETIRAAKIHIG